MNYYPKPSLGLLSQLLHADIEIVEIAAYKAAGMLNKKYSAVLRIMKTLEITIDQQWKFHADAYDNARFTRQGRRRFCRTKEARTTRRLQQIGQNEFFEETEAQLYEHEIVD